MSQYQYGIHGIDWLLLVGAFVVYFIYIWATAEK